MANETLAELEKLQLLDKDQYFTAFGPQGRFFFGTPNGYAANLLPKEILLRIASGGVQKVVYASFGSDPDAWFVVYDVGFGAHLYDSGPATPSRVRDFIEVLAPTNRVSTPTFIRVQFGAKNSYVAWSKVTWIADGIGGMLAKYLKNTSNHNYSSSAGFFRSNKLHPQNIAFHPDGSYFVLSENKSVILPSSALRLHQWHAASPSLEQAIALLCGTTSISFSDLSDLAHFAIDPYVTNAETYVFVKIARPGQEADFVVRYRSDAPVSRLSPRETSLITAPVVRPFRLAVVTHTGRPHKTDSWELKTNRGQKVKVLEDLGNNWFLAQGIGGKNGYIHRTYLNFDINRYPTSDEAYRRYVHETGLIFGTNFMRRFPPLLEYVMPCGKVGCRFAKADHRGVGICMHELENALRGNPNYGYAFLKEERNRWHPDRFARACHPHYRDSLRKKGEAMFVLVGLLMEHERQTTG